MSVPGEFDLIRRYFTPSFLPAHIILGVGDDCAILQIPAGHQLAVSIDTQVVNVHFHADTDPALLASRVLRCAASDLAAMGAEPLGFTLALTLPAVDESWLEKFSTGLLQTAKALSCPLIGGDTTRGPLCISIQVHGSVPTGKAIKRSGAQIGDQVWVSGSLGDGAAALAYMEQRLEVTPITANYLSHRFYQPDIDFLMSVQLRDVASSCIDVSDGLLADLGHICEASGVGARIYLGQLPVAAEWSDIVGAGQKWQWVLSGGDDYRLCFTASIDRREQLLAMGGVYCIGEIVVGNAVQVLDESGAIYTKNPDSGFRHF
ncbi:MAG TPA: thiamine-phosphate kinase [Pseudomonadales bacterium]|nr:thiamine-phosphate kinase [Pseudomonadales bacterium]